MKEGTLAKMVLIVSMVLALPVGLLLTAIPAAADLGCNGCHGTSVPEDIRPLDSAGRDITTGGFPGSHRKHLAAGVAAVSCNPCHSGSAGTPSSYVSTHRDGKVQISDTFDILPHPADSGYYKNGVKAILFNQTSVPLQGSCRNIYCHSNGKQLYATPEWGKSPTGACGTCHLTGSIASNAHSAHLTATYGPLFSGQGVPNACRNCHSHTGELTAPHVDGTVDVTSSGCSGSCHRNALPAWSGGRVGCESCHSGSLSVINGITAPVKAYFAATGHGQPGTNYAASRSCSSCHDADSAHIDGRAGSSKRIATNDNTLCSGCHNDAARVPTSAKQGLPSHVAAPDGLPLMTCTTCHDTHGTSTFSMLKTRIRFNNLSATISFANNSSGFVQTTPPYKGFCQVCHTQTRVFRAGVAQSNFKQHMSFTLSTMKCLECHRHGDSYAFRPRSYDVNMTMGHLWPMERTSGEIWADDAYRVDGKYPDHEFMNLTLSCTGCHYSYSGTQTTSRHSDRGFSAASGRGYDPARPWVLGPGSFGSWSPLHNRQFPDLKARFTNMSSFSRRVDLPVVEYLQQCGVCHVGGGPTQINRYGFSADSWFRWDLFNARKLSGYYHQPIDNSDRLASLELQYSVITSYTPLVPISPWDYFIPGSSMPAVPNNVSVGDIATTNWREQGSLERDCFMCHLDGYNHLKRNEQVVRYGYYGNAAGVGSGVTESDMSTYDGFISYYTSFLYPMVNTGTETSGYLQFDRSFIDRINRHTPSTNCAACHIPTRLEGEGATDDWKRGFLVAEAVPSETPDDPDPVKAANKRPATLRSDYLTRGDVWRTADDDAHPFICSRCHSKTGKFQSADGASAGFMHDPGKGHDPLRWADDPMNDTVKYCEDCHLRKGDLNNDGIEEMSPYGAVDGRLSHERAGLLASVVPTAMRIKDGTGTEETFLGNHLDIISCTACHVNKQYAAARSVDFSTGSQYYNFVGNPGSLAPVADAVPLAFSWRTNTTQKLVNGSPNPYWRRQIFPFNYLTGIYWNNMGAKDANGDGFTTGADNNGTTVIGDPFFARTISAFFSYSTVNGSHDRVASGMKGAGFTAENEWAMTNGADAVTFTQPAEINAFRQGMTASDSGFVPQLRLESQPYLVMHNVMPKGKGLALGRPKQLDADGNVVTYGCNDCHGASGGLFNGAYHLLGNGTAVAGGTALPLTVSWSTTGDVLAKAVYWGRDGAAAQLDFSAGTTTRAPQRWEFLGYDSSRVSALNAIDPASYGFATAAQTNIQFSRSGATVTASFTGMPTPHSRVLVDWGDGNSQWLEGTGDIAGIQHTYPLTAPYYDATTGQFEFLLYLQVFDGIQRKEGTALPVALSS